MVSPAGPVPSRRRRPQTGAGLRGRGGDLTLPRRCPTWVPTYRRLERGRRLPPPRRHSEVLIRRSQGVSTAAIAPTRSCLKAAAAALPPPRDPPRHSRSRCSCSVQAACRGCRAGRRRPDRDDPSPIAVPKRLGAPPLPPRLAHRPQARRQWRDRRAASLRLRCFPRCRGVEPGAGPRWPARRALPAVAYHGRTETHDAVA